jgi:hypothetical protein
MEKRNKNDDNGPPREKSALQVATTRSEQGASRTADRPILRQDGVLRQLSLIGSLTGRLS